MKITQKYTPKDAKMNNLSEIFPDKNLRFNYQFESSTAQFTILPADYGAGRSFWRIPYEIGYKLFEVVGEDSHLLNLGTTGIGGLIDGIANENDRDYLFWHFLDANFQPLGFGMSRKPYSTYTTLSSGAKGAAITVNGVSNTGQFTVGARVRLRNSTVTEWNWGTITAIGATTLSVTLDNNSNYGAAITAASAGNIGQMDSFRPWVVSGSSQTLYAPYYSLCGEIFKTGADIRDVYRRSDPWRFANVDVLNQATVTGTVLFSSGRAAPLWADGAAYRTVAQSTSAGHLLTFLNGGTLISRLETQIANRDIYGNFTTSLRTQGVLGVQSTCVTTNILVLTSYYCEGGMRG